MPLRLTVLAAGLDRPALQVGFTDLTFGPQDPALFTFTPPAGRDGHGRARDRDRARSSADKPTVVGDGWDTRRSCEQARRHDAGDDRAQARPRRRSARRSAGRGAADG